MTTEQTITDLFADPTTPKWLISAMRTLLTHDPVDAASEAEFLADLMAAWEDECTRKAKARAERWAEGREQERTQGMRGGSE